LPSFFLTCKIDNMKNKLSHQQRLAQRMALTPQMRQSIKLLSMSIKDLNEHIESVLTANPFLKKLVETTNREQYSRSSRETSFRPELQVSSDRNENPRQGILSQLTMLGLDKKAFEIAEYLIYELDDNGYLSAELEAGAGDLGVSIEDAEKGLETVQGLEPAGIGARDVGECLELQLKRAGKEDSLEHRIVTEALNELVKNDADTIARSLGTDKDKVLDALRNIKKLNPRPASAVLGEDAQAVIPELIAKVKRNKVQIAINRERLPQLKLYNPYEHELDIIKDPEARKFLKDNMDSAKTLMDGLKRREETISDVATYILGFQQEALAVDSRDIKCLTIKDVARALGFHPSTISRAVSNKYIQVNDKVMALKDLLSQGLKKGNGETTSKAQVLNRISEIVSKEDRSAPLSDEKICGRLESEGIMIKRRTVAKYREALRILPTYLRRKARS